MKIIKASLKDIPILCGYLHDAYFKPDEIMFEEGKRCFSMTLDRVYYERAEKGKVCWIIPVIRYPWIRSCFSIVGTKTLEQQWRDRGVDGPDNQQLLMDIKLSSENTIVLGSNHFKITLIVDSDSELTLVDEVGSEHGPQITDFSKGIFYGMDEISKLRVEAE